MQSGSEQFNDWIKRRFPDGATNEEVAEYLGMDKSLVTKLRKDTRGVGLKFAHHLERRCGIPTQAWLSGPADELVAAGSKSGRKPKSDK